MTNTIFSPVLLMSLENCSLCMKEQILEREFGSHSSVVTAVSLAVGPYIFNITLSGHTEGSTCAFYPTKLFSFYWNDLDSAERNLGFQEQLDTAEYVNGNFTVSETEPYVLRYSCDCKTDLELCIGYRPLNSAIPSFTTSSELSHLISKIDN
ncbi:hypothetical protein BB560_003609 [Smittium megazygosporum]|uniref:Uncharacterized protein n=1 Tax=Smittium megazygosporum TaxID=133381 RepID=A0A2T9ZBH5_9FUNG|nr:hypothetical protein BB560_003609 [Smittium megazygosporum]